MVDWIGAPAGLSGEVVRSTVLICVPWSVYR